MLFYIIETCTNNPLSKIRSRRSGTLLNTDIQINTYTCDSFDNTTAIKRETEWVTGTVAARIGSRLSVGVVCTLTPGYDTLLLQLIPGDR